MGMTNFQNKPRSNSKTIQCPEATVRFLIGGTQTNQVVINTVLEPYEGVISEIQVMWQYMKGRYRI